VVLNPMLMIARLLASLDNLNYEAAPRHPVPQKIMKAAHQRLLTIAEGRIHYTGSAITPAAVRK